MADESYRSSPPGGPGSLGDQPNSVGARYEGSKGFPRALEMDFFACGIWLICLGGYFMLVRPSLLPEDLRYLGLSMVRVEAALPHLASWLHNVFTVMGGFIAGSGVLLMFVSVRAIPQCFNGTGVALGSAGLLTVITMSWTNFVLDSNFKWLLLVPAIAWLLGLACYAVGRNPEHAIVAVPQVNVDAPK